MKTLYLECNMGAAGDMLMSALLELHPNPQQFLQRMNGLGLPGVTLAAGPSVKCGITGTHISVTVHGEEEQSVDVPQGHHHYHGLEAVSYTHLPCGCGRPPLRIWALPSWTTIGHCARGWQR